MKITLELPDTTQAAFFNYIVEVGDRMLLVSQLLNKNDIMAGYKDCRKYEVKQE